jgi:hypothetical protein
MSSRVEISFVVGTWEESNHRTDSRFRKVFEVEWPGRPMPGEMIEVDIGHPIQEEAFEVGGIYRATESTPWLFLKRVVVDEDEVEWDGGLSGYGRYARRHGWEVFWPAALAQPMYAARKPQLQSAGVTWQDVVSVSSEHHHAWRAWRDGERPWRGALEDLVELLNKRASSSFTFAD